MKVTKFSPGGLPQPYATWSTGYVTNACESETAAIASNALAIGGVVVGDAPPGADYHLVSTGPGTAEWVLDIVVDSGRWEVVVFGVPAEAVTNPADDDWVYAWVAG